MNVEDVEQGTKFARDWKRSYTKQLRVERRVGPFELRVYRQKKADKHLEWEVSTSLSILDRGQAESWPAATAFAEMALTRILHGILAEVEP